MTTKSILAQFGEVTSITINNTYKEYTVSFAVPSQYSEYTDRQLASTTFSKEIRAKIREQIGTDNIRANTVLVFVGTDKMGKIVCQIRC